MNMQDHELLVQSIGQFRRAIFRDFVVGIIHTFEDFDFSLPQLAALLLLEEEGELTIKRVAELLKRSVSATSRLLDQLVVRGLVSRHEDERDRRAKLVALTEPGRVFMEMVEQRRAAAQLAVMEYLSTEEQAQVAQAMFLLAEAGRRRD
jgi:DNA-binding MarR family transcriptional regulator